MESQIVPQTGAVDMSIWGLFLEATITVQAVIILLLLCSVWSWAIMIDKHLAFRKARRSFEIFEDKFWSGRILDDLYDDMQSNGCQSSIERIFFAGMKEWHKTLKQEHVVRESAMQRIERSMNVAFGKATAELEKKLGFLATVGSIAPFVGLFGTVWGIKNSFESIAASQNTNLSVVAPGIAEALFATALGLLAAIPAVVAYNKLLADSQRLSGTLDNFIDEFSTILSRQIDKRADEE